MTILVGFILLVVVFAVVSYGHRKRHGISRSTFSNTPTNYDKGLRPERIECHHCCRVIEDGESFWYDHDRNLPFCSERCARDSKGARS